MLFKHKLAKLKAETKQFFKPKLLNTLYWGNDTLFLLNEAEYSCQEIYLVVKIFIACLCLAGGSKLAVNYSKDKLMHMWF